MFFTQQTSKRRSFCYVDTPVALKIEYILLFEHVDGILIKSNPYISIVLHGSLPFNSWF